MRPRQVTALFQTAARVWLSLALVSLALPVRWRSGLWLPLHLTLAGAAATAIAGAMPNFVLAMTASGGPSDAVVRVRFVMLSAGVALLGAGMVARSGWVVAVGGLAFAASMVMLAHLVAHAWRSSLVRRHGALVAGYGVALACVLVGATLGGLVGAGVAGATMIPRFGRAHVVLNVLGFVSVTVLATLVTFVPTLLRVRMPARRAGPALGLACVGVMLLAGGAASGSTWPFAAGAWMYAGGALVAGSLAISALRRPRNFAIPSAAMHVGAGLVWFVAGSIALAWSSVRGPAALDAGRPWFLVVFVAAWTVQILLGAWSYLLPMALAGHPDERRGWLAVGEIGGRTQVVVANLGLLLLLAGVQGWVGSPARVVGATLALAAAVVALTRVWAFPWLARHLPVGSARAVEVWG